MVYTGGRKDWELEYEFLEKNPVPKPHAVFAFFY